MPVGYSGKPLFEKLGVKADATLVVVNAPKDYKALLEGPPPSVRITSTVGREPRMVHLFCSSVADLKKRLADLTARLARDGMIWVSWPKKTSRVPTDITEDRIREVAFPLGLVDVKVCAVSDVWSGLKLVIRKENR